MKAVLESKIESQAKFSMIFSAEDFDAALDRAYKSQRGKIVIPGFRKGKAPRSIIERHFGEGIFFEDAIDDCLEKAYPLALDELKLKPVDRPSLEFGDEPLAKGKGFEVKVSVTVVPDITVKNYKGIKAEIPERKVEESDIDADIEMLRQRNARLVVVEGLAEKG
ncbi:MAG: trigger factor family protein, partial [Clostridiales bacterium]|nr:trigger factor family protein [Clostridiales bacterium]